MTNNTESWIKDTIHRNIERAQTALDHWIEHRLKSAPADAFEWSKDRFADAAAIKVWSDVENMIKDAPLVDRLRDVHDALTRETMRKARYPEQSSSQQSNLMSIEMMSAMAKAAEDVGNFLKMLESEPEDLDDDESDDATTADDLQQIVDRPLSVSDFHRVAPGTEIRLYYNDTNVGDFLWRHEYVDGDRLVGQFKYDDDEWSQTGDYLYDFNGAVCRGSGAEPCWSRVAPEPEYDDDESEI